MSEPLDPPARILTVCTHNRTRSVMMAALLQSMLDDRLGDGAAAVRSAGFVAEGLPPIDDAVAAMRRRGLDVSAHRSGLVTPALLDGADLVVTAEREHVVRIATLSPAAFGRAMTLPELLERAAADGPENPDLRAWVERLTAERTAGAYLRELVAEVADPTGSSSRAFEQAVVDIERRCADLSTLLTHVLRRRTG